MASLHSTQEFDNRQFRAHGWLQLELVGNVVVYRAEGPFNVEAVIALGKARLAGLAEWGAFARKAAIVEFHGSMMMSKDALEAYSAGLRNHFKQVDPPQAIAWVVPEQIEGRLTMLPHFAKIFQEIEVNWRAFEDFDSAMTWIDNNVD